MRKIVRFSIRNFSINRYSTNNVAMILSGCGHWDGTDVQEASSLLIHLSKNNFQVSFFAPTEEIEETFLYVPNKEVDKGEERYPHKESTRISKTPVQDIKKLNSKDFSALIIPGGEGALRNLSTYLNESEGKFSVHPKVESVLKEFHKESKPLLVTSHAALLLGRVLGQKNGQKGITVSLGENEDPMAEECRKWGNETAQVNRGQDIYNDKNIISVPATLVPLTNPNDIFISVQKSVQVLKKILRPEEYKLEQEQEQKKRDEELKK